MVKKIYEDLTVISAQREKISPLIYGDRLLEEQKKHNRPKLKVTVKPHDTVFFSVVLFFCFCGPPSVKHKANLMALAQTKWSWILRCSSHLVIFTPHRLSNN